MAAGPRTSKQERIDHWVTALSEQQMPVFAQTARIVATETARDERSAAELAEMILQDASMTARLLRVANSIVYNPNRNPISTVSRAIVLLGFEAVRSICYSIAIIDSVHDGPYKQHAVQEMARAFHAATQARTMAIQRQDKSPEEVFIAALLYHLGHVAFWCFAEQADPEAGAQLAARLAAGGSEGVAEERKALGFSLAELTVALNRQWHLSELLGSALSDDHSNDPRASNVTLAHEVARTAEGGWETPEMKQILERVAESLYLPLEKVTRMVRSNAEDAVASMSRLGAREVGKLIPVPPEYARRRREVVDAGPPPERSQFPEPDAELQMKILRELSELVTDEQPDINMVFEMVLEGVYRGVGMDRTVFALMSPDHKSLRAKYALGWDRQQLTQAFHFALSRGAPRNVFDHVIKTGHPLWVRQPPDPSVAGLITPEVQQVTGEAPFFIMPIAVQQRPIGILYADRRPSRRPVERSAFTDFKLFGQQAVLGLGYLKRH